MSPPQPDLSANERRIDYVEFLVRDLARTKQFYGGVFGWELTDYARVRVVLRRPAQRRLHDR
jgi:predicted enzyme related to lactoylglutathione lyase